MYKAATRGIRFLTLQKTCGVWTLQWEETFPCSETESNYITNLEIAQLYL